MAGPEGSEQAVPGDALPGIPAAEQLPVGHAGSADLPGQGLTKEEAFLRILNGHWRYLHDTRHNTSTSPDDRARHAEGQYPFAAILGCADSRVSPEVIFDQGQGDIFVVRVAGHVAGDYEIASLEYAIQHLGVSLVLVMGHAKCGAVKSALGAGVVHGPIGRLLAQIYPAVDHARQQPGELLDEAIRAHVVGSAQALVERSVVMREAVERGTLRIIGLVYDLATGDLEIRHTIG
ncbi:MAG: carbonic anhydrase [Planctomycetota bacterium]